MCALVTCAWRSLLAALLILGVLVPPPGTAPAPPRTQGGGAPAPLRVSALAFVDARHGWALGTVCGLSGPCAPALRSTRDGGQTWQVLPVPSRSVIPTASTMSQVRFATARDGWLFGPTLYVTHDGGQTWTHDGRVRGVVTLAAAGRSVWAVPRRCALSRPCPPLLVVSSDAGRTWRRAATQPPLLADVGQVLRPSARDGWIVSLGPGVFHG